MEEEWFAHCGRAGRWMGGWASGRWLEHIHMPSHRVEGGKSRVRGGRVRTQSALRLSLLTMTS